MVFGANSSNCLLSEISEVKVKYNLLIDSSCKIQVSETWSQSIHTKEISTPLPPLWVCYAGRRVVWCQRVTTDREQDVINHKFLKVCRCRVESHG
jgi:hypothetical protein